MAEAKAVFVHGISDDLEEARSFRSTGAARVRILPISRETRLSHCAARK
jgi:hypothetical protein